MQKFTLFLFTALAVALFSCSDGGAGTSSSDSPSDQPEASATRSANAVSDTSNPASAASGDAVVLIETDYGNIKVKLYDSTPKHKENFLKLTREGYYAGTLFHRVIPGFMIQGGDPDSKNAPSGQALGMGGPGYTIDAEIGAKHFRGALAAARTGGPTNPEKRSSGSQFYIVQNGPVPPAQMDQIIQQKGTQYTPEEIDYYLKVGGTPFLDDDYTVFGQVLEGMDAVDKIANVLKDNRDRPVEDIRIKKVTQIQ